MRFVSNQILAKDLFCFEKSVFIGAGSRWKISNRIAWLGGKADLSAAFRLASEDIKRGAGGRFKTPNPKQWTPGKSFWQSD